MLRTQQACSVVRSQLLGSQLEAVIEISPPLGGLQNQSFDWKGQHQLFNTALHSGEGRRTMPARETLFPPTV